MNNFNHLDRVAVRVDSGCYGGRKHGPWLRGTFLRLTDEDLAVVVLDSFPRLSLLWQPDCVRQLDLLEKLSEA